MGLGVGPQSPPALPPPLVRQYWVQYWASESEAVAAEMLLASTGKGTELPCMAGAGGVCVCMFGG